MFRKLLYTTSTLLVATPLWAQVAAPQHESKAPPAPEETAPMEDAAPQEAPLPELPSPTGMKFGDADSDVSNLTIHVVTTQNTYGVLDFDIFDTNTKQVVASGSSADEGAGFAAPSFDLPSGTYKIVRSGEPITNRRDFATVRLDGPTDYVIVLDAGSGAFRGSGILTDELPSGTSIAGIRISLNVGGTIMLDQQENVVGTTNGDSAAVGLFGNFSMQYERGDHYLKVDSRLNVNIQDPRYASAFSTSDFFEGSALYAFNINNPFVGPYARAGFRTKVYPGYLYLENDAPTGTVEVNRLDGTVDNYAYGSESNVDDLRIEVAKAFAPLVLQEELGANLKAVDIDLKLLKLNVATRLGFAVRQGITNDLLVETGRNGSTITLTEIDNYWTLGPIVGANATVTFARWLFGSGDVGIVAPLRDRDRAGEGFAERLLIDLSATGGLKFPAISFFYGSIDYTMRLQRDGYLTTDTQFAHSVMARANLQIF